MVALAILSITILILSYFGSSFSLTKGAQIDTQAQAFARSYFDNLRASWSTRTTFGAGTLPSITPPSGFSNPAVTLEDIQHIGTQVVLRRVTLRFTGPPKPCLSFCHRGGPATPVEAVCAEQALP